MVSAGTAIEMGHEDRSPCAFHPGIERTLGRIEQKIDGIHTALPATVAVVVREQVLAQMAVAVPRGGESKPADEAQGRTWGRIFEALALILGTAAALAVASFKLSGPDTAQPPVRPPAIAAPAMPAPADHPTTGQ